MSCDSKSCDLADILSTAKSLTDWNVISIAVGSYQHSGISLYNDHGTSWEGLYEPQTWTPEPAKTFFL